MTQQTKPVVAGVEDSDAGRRAVTWAAERAALQRLPLRLVHVLEWPVGADPDPEGHLPDNSWSARFRAAGREVLDAAVAAAREAAPGLDVTGDLVDGDTWKVLKELTPGAEMLVLGSRGRSTITELLTTGGIAVPVAAHGHCPVVVVRGEEPPPGTEPRVMVGVDESESASLAVSAAFAEASLRGATLHAVSVWRDPSGAVVSLLEKSVEDARLELSEQLAGWAERYPDVRVHSEVAFGHPVRILANASKGALALFVGSRGHGGFAGMLLGSVSNGLIHHAHCPLVVVPAGARDEPEAAKA